MTGISGTMRNITQIIEKETEIRKLAYYDSVTNLPNDSLIKDALDALINEDKEFSVFYINFVVNMFYSLFTYLETI